MAADAIMTSLLFVSITTAFPTTRDVVGQMDPSQLEVAKALGIFVNMIMILSIFILLPVMWFTWGVLVTRGRLMNDIERMFRDPIPAPYKEDSK